MTQHKRQDVIDDPLDALASQPDAGSAIDAWLAVFARLMHLPESTRQSIRMELREHLRERVRDLLLSSGPALIDERDAVHTAIEELGETAELARRFEAANQSNRRRMLMHATLMLAGAGAIVAGVVTFSNSNNSANSVAVSRFEAGELAHEPPESLIKMKITLPEDTTLRNAVASIAEQAKLGVIVDWGAMQDNGITTDETMGVSVTEIPAGEALTLIAESASTREARLDWRARNGSVEFGLRNALDRREIELVTYDVTTTINLIAGNFTDSKDKAAEQVLSLLTELVTPEYWRDNGGDLAQMRLVGGRLFVEAPTRTHAKVKWILDQLPNMPGDKPEAKASGDVPMLEDVPLVGSKFAAAQKPRLEALREEWSAAQTEFDLVRNLYHSGTSIYKRAEKRFLEADDEYRHALDLWQRTQRPAAPADEKSE
jgi:hypothetical protein